LYQAKALACAIKHPAGFLVFARIDEGCKAAEATCDAPLAGRSPCKHKVADILKRKASVNGIC
jgi:hypothetical protein